MAITTDFTGDHILLQALLVQSEEQPLDCHIVQLENGDGWKKYDKDNNLISLSIRLWDNSDFSDQADAFVDTLSQEAGIDTTDEILAKLQVMSERLQRFAHWA